MCYERQNYDLMCDVFKYDTEALRKYYQDTEKHKIEIAPTLKLLRGKLTAREQQAIDYFLRGTDNDNGTRY